MSLDVLFDATPFSLAKPTGAGRYIINLLDSLTKIDKENNYFVFGFEKELSLIQFWPENFTYRRIDKKNYLGPFAIEWARRSFVWRYCNERHFDVFQSNLDPFPLKDRRIKKVCMLYDVMRTSPEFTNFTPQTLRTKIRTKVRYSNAKKYDHILTISDYSKSQITLQLGISAKKITVTHLAAEKNFSPGDIDEKLLQKDLINRPFILFVGEFGRQKNEAGLIKAFSTGVEKHLIPDDMSLVLVGDKSRMPDRTKRLVHNIGREKRIRLVGTINEKELINLYRASSVFVLPSFVEGFGLPALEAMACGTPVIVSNVSSLPEVVGDAGLVVSPDSANEIIHSIARICSDEYLRNNLIEKGLKRAEEFSYKTVVLKTLEMYRQLCK